MEHDDSESGVEFEFVSTGLYSVGEHSMVEELAKLAEGGDTSSDEVLRELGGES